MSILPLGGFFARRTYPGLILYVNSRCVSIVMRINAVDLRKIISNYLREQLDNGIYLGVLCVHKRLSKAEKDEVGVCHETVSSYSRRVNLNKKSDRATNRAYLGIAIPSNLFSSN
jgi:hypothetical protein